MAVTDRALRTAGRGVGALGAALGAGGILVLLLRGNTDLLLNDFALENGLLGVGCGVVAWLLIGRQPRNAAIWALAGAAFFTGLYAGADATVDILAEARGLNVTVEAIRDLSPRMLPRDVALAVAVTTWTWYPGIFLLVTFAAARRRACGPPRFRVHNRVCVRASR